ncbi:LysE family transporter [Kiloniella spongiae]|uniref:LysE family transporter n=1 Tax=Kiloniella spongiae TaxID=1489064 RepID=A0A0H2M9V2_9PROT|nr:LysE family translocator [Kiloniella spongiae]KLN59113.1 LysE family transporter [Kiloniella spongiae]
MTVEFLLTSLVIILIPGTGVLYTIATGLAAGRTASIAAAFGCTLGIVPALIAAAFGLAAILHTSALLFQVVKFAGVAYLLYLAYQTFKDNGPVSLEQKDRLPISVKKIVSTGALINVLNPKLSIFFLAFLPQFVDAKSNTWMMDTLTLGLTFMAMTFIVFIGYGIFAAFIGNFALKSERFMRWFRRTTAAAFAGFGFRLAFSDNS